MASKDLRFKLGGRTFHEIDPEIMISNMNAMAFVSMVGMERPGQIEIEIDSAQETLEFLLEIASEVGYSADIRAPIAVFTRV
jgi:hypothetical protein